MEFEERKTEFMKRYRELVMELKCDFQTLPMLIPTSDRIFSITLSSQIVDITDAPVKSPFSV